MTDLRVRLIIEAQNNSSNALTQTRNDVRGIDDQFAQLQTRLNQFIAFKLAEVVTGWGAALVRKADGYQSLTAKIGLVTDGYEEQAQVQEALFDIAQRSRASLDQTNTAYVRNVDAIKRMGGDTQTALTVTETLNKAIAITSQGLSQDTAAMQQFSQALGKGALNGDELNSIMEKLRTDQDVSRWPGRTDRQAQGIGRARQIDRNRFN